MDTKFSNDTPGDNDPTECMLKHEASADPNRSRTDSESKVKRKNLLIIVLSIMVLVLVVAIVALVGVIIAKQNDKTTKVVFINVVPFTEPTPATSPTRLPSTFQTSTSTPKNKDFRIVTMRGVGYKVEKL